MAMLDFYLRVASQVQAAFSKYYRSTFILGRRNKKFHSAPDFRALPSEARDILQAGANEHFYDQLRSTLDAIDLPNYAIVSYCALLARDIELQLLRSAPRSKVEIFLINVDEHQERNRSFAIESTRSFDAVFLQIPTHYSAIHTIVQTIRERISESGFLWIFTIHSYDTASLKIFMPILTSFMKNIPSRWRIDKAQCNSSSNNTFCKEAFLDSLILTEMSVLSHRNFGGSLVRNLLEVGAISLEILNDEEGREILQVLCNIEDDLVKQSEIPPGISVTLATPDRSIQERINRIFAANIKPLPEIIHSGIAGPLQPWIDFNLGFALTSARASEYAAPFPPLNLMFHTTGLRHDQDFAQHGADILLALSAASPKPLSEFQSLFDFGVGVGRLARYFKGFCGRYVGADIDRVNVDWVSGHLPWVETVLTEPTAALPLETEAFDGVVSISVFTHIDRETTEFYVDELHRLTRPGALLFLTLHGDKALDLALTNAEVGRLVGISPDRLEQARLELAEEGFHFAEQYTHLTRANYRYGTTFVSQQGAEAIFGRRFKVVGFVPGAIHAFQDLIVLERP